jgi:hypothetical protein
MGISHGVHIANLHLLYYEFQFRKQLVDIILAAPDWIYTGSLAHKDMAKKLLAPNANLEFITAASNSWPDAACLILQSFQFFGRFVDHVLVGPNPYFSCLLKTTYSLLGGRIAGIYPPYLQLDANFEPDWHGYKVQYLDVELRLRCTEVPESAAQRHIVGEVVLFEKLSSPKFRNVHILKYHHVFSQLSLSCTYGVLSSQLCRFVSHTTIPGDWVQNAATCLHRFYIQGFEHAWLHAQFDRWLHAHAEQHIGTTRLLYLGHFAWLRFCNML